jgi:HEPN domain-containing protein
VPDYGKNTGEVSWHTIDYAFSETGLDLHDYDFNWEPGKEQFEQDIKRVTEKGWAAAAKQLRSDLGIKHNAEIKVAKMTSRQASEKVGPGDSELAFELATEIPRTDKALRATFSKSFRKGPREMLKAISRLEEPYVTLRRQSRWMDGAQEPWKEVSVKDAKQLIVLGKKLRKDLSRLLRENKIAANQQYDTDYLPRRQISPDNKWEMPDMGEEPVSEITHCQHSVNPMEHGKHLMMSRELLKVAKDLLALEADERQTP